jgi:hypothetical protein
MNFLFTKGFEKFVIFISFTVSRTSARLLLTLKPCSEMYFVGKICARCRLLQEQI